MLTFIELIFPPKCSFCGKMDNVDHDSFVCSKCMNNLPFYKEEYRYHNTSISRETPFKSLDAMYCLFKYTNNVKEAFIRYKFQGDISVYKSFALLMYKMLLCEKALESVDCITAVPISDVKFAQRGFNQSLLIANEISKLSGIQYMELLKRPNQGVTQSKVSAEERLHAKERFRVIDNINIANKSVLLIDDIITSGSTLDGCCQLLKDSGAVFVKACVFASGRKDL